MAVFAAFWPALQAGFVDWDDPENFLENYAYRGLSMRHLAWMATTTHMGPYQPLAWLSLAIDYTIFGLEPFGYHLTNVALHAASAVAFYFVALQLLRAALERASATRAPLDLHLAAAASALFFAVHPLRCESVVWITERRDVLSALFVTCSLAAWLRYVRTTSASMPRWFLVSLVLFLLALLAKASGVVLPLVLVVLDVWPLSQARVGHARRSLVLEKLPFFALSLVFGAIAIWGQSSAQNTLKSLTQEGFAQRLTQAAYGSVFYIAKTVWPANLRPIYEMPQPFDVLAPLFVLTSVAALAIPIVTFALRRRFPAPWIAWLCYAIAIAPVSGLVQAGSQLVADRYTHLACMPFALLFGGALLTWIERRPGARVFALQLAAGIVLVFGVLTFRQSSVWHDSERLWTHTLAIEPNSPNACQNLGVLRLREGMNSNDLRTRFARYNAALELFERGFKASGNPQFLVNRGLVLMMFSEADPVHEAELIAQAHTAIESAFKLERPEDIPYAWHLRRGMVLLKLRRFDEALAELELFVRHEPDHVLGRRMLSIALASVNRAVEAVPHLKHALELEPADSSLWLRMGLVQAQLGHRDEAATAFENVIDIQLKKFGRGADKNPDCMQARAELERVRGAHDPIEAH